MATVEIARKIEEVNFEPQATVVCHSGPRPQACNPRQRAVPCTEQVYRKDTRYRRPIVLQLHVGGRKPQAAANLVAMHNPPGDAVAPPEIGLCRRQIARCERFAPQRKSSPTRSQRVASFLCSRAVTKSSALVWANA